jgi:transcription termination factor NusB
MLQGQTPFKVAINEGLLLAQEFSTADSPRFINGVLDAVAQELNDQMDRSAG